MDPASVVARVLGRATSDPTSGRGEDRSSRMLIKYNTTVGTNSGKDKLTLNTCLNGNNSG
jgi:hypothetical protein